MSKLEEPKPLPSLSQNMTSNWAWELAVLLRYTSILIVVGINKIKERK